MKKFLTLGLLTTCLSSFSAFAQNDDICDTKLFKQMLATEKQGLIRPKMTPSSDLQTLMEESEILCPMQIEKDFNGDKLLDWIGVVEKQGQFFLMAYLSTSSKHQLTQIKKYNSAPNNQYFDVATQQLLNDVAGHVEFNSEVKFAAVENQLGGVATAYVWDGAKMSSLIEFKWPIVERPL